MSGKSKCQPISSVEDMKEQLDVVLNEVSKKTKLHKLDYSS